MSEDKVEILYIGGCSRSGSTLLERMLGQIDGFCSVGEVWHIWHRSFAENQLCGCDKPFKECEFWNAVVEEAFGAFHHVDLEEIQSLRYSVQSVQHIPLLTLPFLQTAKYKERLKVYSRVLGKLYMAISKVSGCRFIVDSSKFPHYATILDGIPEIDLYVVHLVRDSRATAYSWQRKRVRPEVHWKTAYMDRHGLMGSAIEWSAMNFLLQSLKYTGAKYMSLCYEELVNRPRESLFRIGEHIGEEWRDLSFFRGAHAVYLGANHTVSGNPERFQRGVVRIRPDVEWQEKMARSQKFVVTALTWPLLLNYGYWGSNTKNNYLMSRIEDTRDA